MWASDFIVSAMVLVYLVWSVDRAYVDSLLDSLHYPDRLKLDRPVDRPTFFQ